MSRGAPCIIGAAVGEFRVLLAPTLAVASDVGKRPVAAAPSSSMRATGTSRICGTCRAHRPTKLRFGVTRTFGERLVRLAAGATSWPIAVNQRFCSAACRRLGRRRAEAVYATTAHRGTRKRLAPTVASGLGALRSRCRLQARRDPPPRDFFSGRGRWRGQSYRAPSPMVCTLPRRVSTGATFRPLQVGEEVLLPDESWLP